MFTKKACFYSVFRRFRMLLDLIMVPRRGLEPPRPCGHQHLKLACLPISPSGQDRGANISDLFMGCQSASTTIFTVVLDCQTLFDRPLLSLELCVHSRDEYECRNLSLEKVHRLHTALFDRYHREAECQVLSRL